MSSNILLIFGTVVVVVALTEVVKQRLRISGIAAGIRPKSTSSDGSSNRRHKPLLRHEHLTLRAT